jgi:hypothetical protein
MLKTIVDLKRETTYGAMNYLIMTMLDDVKIIIPLFMCVIEHANGMNEGVIDHLYLGVHLRMKGG